MRAILGALAVLAWPAVARAQYDDTPLPGDSTDAVEADTDRTYDGRWWGDLGFYSGGTNDEGEPQVTATLITVAGGFDYRLPKAPVAFEAQAGLLALFLSPEEGDAQSTARLMNPLLAAYFAPRFGRVDLRVGVGLGVPIASLRGGDDAAIDSIAYLSAAATNGLWDWWRWLPDRLALLLPTASVEARFGQHFVLGGALGLHLLFDTGSDEGTTGDGGTDSIFQLGADVAYRSRSTRTGALLRVVTLLSGDGEDGEDTQLSVEPYLQFEMGSSFFRIALTLNLDQPFGFSFASGPLKIWGLHLGGGTRF